MADITTIASVQDKVRERIQTTFMELLPDEMFKGLVEQELSKFLREQLPNLVVQEAKDHLTKKMQAEFVKPEWGETWTNAQPTPSAFMKEILRELAPDLVSALFAQLSMNVVNNLRSQMPRVY